MAAPVTVRVPPDYLTAWIGVAGVMIGFVLSTAALLVRDARKDKKDRQHVLRSSADVLLGAGNSLAVLMGMPGTRIDEYLLSYRSGRTGASIRYQVPGRKPILLHVGRAGRKDFAAVEMMLARSGAFAKLDPPYPSAENLSTAA